jgi:hypothetical protein
MPCTTIFSRLNEISTYLLKLAPDYVQATENLDGKHCAGNKSACWLETAGIQGLV